MTFEYYDAAEKIYIPGALLYSTVDEVYQVMASIIAKQGDTWSVLITDGTVSATANGTITYDPTAAVGSNLVQVDLQTPYTQSHTANVTISVNGIERVNESNFTRTTFTALRSVSTSEGASNPFMPTDIYALGNNWWFYRGGGMRITATDGLVLLGGGSSGTYNGIDRRWYSYPGKPMNLRGYLGPIGEHTVPFFSKLNPAGGYLSHAMIIGVLGDTFVITDVGRALKLGIEAAPGAVPVEPDWPVIL